MTESEVQEILQGVHDFIDQANYKFKSQGEDVMIVKVLHVRRGKRLELDIEPEVWGE